MKTPLRSTARALRLALPALAVAACDGGGSGGGVSVGSGGRPIVEAPGAATPNAAEPAILTAVLLDGIVEGARYESGHLSGITDANGLLRYVEGEPVRVLVGGIELGRTHPVPGGTALAHLAAENVVTPLGLAGAGEDLTDVGALDRVRLLMALDDDGDAGNGIRITTAVDAALSGAAAPDFGAGTAFEADAAVAATLSAVAAVRGERPVLVDIAAARAHLCESLARTDCVADAPAPGAAVEIDGVGETSGGVTSGTPETPIEVSPVDFPPVDVSPVEIPVVEQPPAQTPIAEIPPVAMPPVDATPVEAPPIEQPPVEVPAVEPPPVDAPPVETPAVEQPPVDAPPVETPTVEQPPIDAPPVETPAVEQPPVDAPPVETPTVEQPPIDAPPVETPTVEQPPIDAPPVETPAVEQPPIDVPPANATPEMSGVAPARAAVGVPWRFDVTATDADGDALVFSLDGAPAWMSLDAATGSLSGTPSSDDIGDSPAIVLSASDGTDTSALDAFAVEVFQPNRTPQLVGMPFTTIDVGASYDFVPSASDADGNALVFSLDGAPAWMSLDSTTGALSGTPTANDVGTVSNIVLSASDGTDTTALTAFAVEVVQPNRAPRLAGTPPAAIDVGASYAFVPSASDADGDALYFTANGLPAWATIDPLNGALNGVPAAGDVGEATGLTIRATDGEAFATLGPFDLAVVQPNRAPEIDGQPPSGVLAGETWSFVPAASDADDDTLSWTATNLLTWLALDAASGALEGVAVEGGTASGVTLVASDGETSTTLGPFDVTVLAATDLARAATASQGSTYSGGYPASAAIDGDDATFNHTLCHAGTRWLQVDLGRRTIVSRLVVVNRVGSNQQRLDGASVHVGDLPRAAGPFDDAASPEARVATLDASARREIVLDAPRRARYVTIETPGDCLHVASLEVHGRYPDEPAFSNESPTFGAVPPVVAGDVVGTVAANDAQGDPIAWRLDGDAPFAIDATGTITATRALEHNVLQRHDFRVVASDGRHEASVPVAVRLLDRTGARLERWTDLPGGSIASLTGSPRFDEAADEIGVLPGLEQSGLAHGSYGERLTALLRAPESGDYVFSVTGDDATRLALSSSDDPALATVIATQNTWRTFRNYAGGAKSAPIRLEAGRVYAIEALHKEGGGSDHVSVGWRRVEDSEFVKLPDSLVHVGWLDAASSRPEVAEHIAEHLLEQDAAVSRPIVDLDASDGQGDALAYAVVGDVPFAVDADGRVTVAGPLEPGHVYTFDVTIDDGTHTVTRSLTVETTAEGAIERALADGDASGVTEREIVDALEATRTRLDVDHDAVLDALFGRNDPTRSVGPLDWDPTQQSNVVSSLAIAGARPVLVSNHRYNGGESAEEALALAGIGAHGERMLMLGGNPLHAIYPDRQGWGGSGNAALQTFMENAVHWLADGVATDDAGFDIVISQQRDIGWAQHDRSTHGWFADAFPDATINAEDDCDGASLAACLQDADLLVIGNAVDATDDDAVPDDIPAVVAAVADARARGVAVMFLRDGYDRSALDTALATELGIGSGGNFFTEGLQGQAPAEASEPDGLATLVTTVRALDTGRLDFDYAADGVCREFVGKTTCDESRASNGEGVTMDVLFGAGRDALRGRLSSLDRRGRDVFSLDTGYRADKLAVLLADKWRENVRFPLDKLSSDPHDFHRARFADAAIHYARPSNALQPDMGVFTDAQQSLHDGLAITRAFTRMPTSHDGWTSTGAYVPPGRPVVVTRTDASSVEVLVRTNMLRDTTRIWNANGYDRPSRQTGNAIEVPTGGSVTLSSPHGGPLYVWTKRVAADHADAGVSVTLSLAGVLDNPLLDAFDEPSVVAFSDALMATDSDWADVRTPFAEVHSLKSHVTTAFARQDGNESNGYTTADVLDYIDDLNGYLIKGNYEYAGFASASLSPLGAGVADWCTANALTSVEYGGETVNLCTDERIHALPRVQHINADHVAACGGLCSGNPFDTGYPVGPLGWGENHEMGHNLQRTRLKIYGGRSNEVSNNIFPLQTSRQWAIDEGLARHPSQTRPNYRQAFEMLQAAIVAGTAPGIDHPLWSGTGTYDLAFERLAFFVQLVYASGEWDFYTKAYLADRILADATRSASTDDTKWLAVRSSLGMGGYSAVEAKAVSGNDFLYLMASNTDGTDYADWFAAWGVEVSEAARAQVAANGIVDMEPAVFRYVEGTLPVARPTGTIPLDGVSAWADPEG